MVKHWVVLYVTLCILSLNPQQLCKEFVVVIPSYNNTRWCKKNIESVLNQTYPYFRIMFIDDASTDATATKIRKLIKKRRAGKRTTLIRNIKNQGALANIWHAIETAKDHEIIVCLDGDDWLAHENVLSHLNAIYQDPNIWLTYGQFENWPTKKRGWCKAYPPKIISSNRFREYGFFAAQPRTFYAGLAQRVKVRDLQENGKFFKTAGDVALMFPLLEMAGKHHKYIDKIIYTRNVRTPINDFKVHQPEQVRITKLIRKQKPYKPMVLPTSWSGTSDQAIHTCPAPPAVSS